MKKEEIQRLLAQKKAERAEMIKGYADKADELSRIKREVERKKIVDKCLDSFYEFLKLVFTPITKVKLVENWHIRYLCDTAQKAVEPILWNLDPTKKGIKKGGVHIINISPGETKSTIFSVALPVWCWLKDARMRILTASHTQRLSNDFSQESRELMEQNEIFSYYFGGMIELAHDRNRVSDYKNTAGGYRYASQTTNANAIPTGRHFPLFIIDDSCIAPNPDLGIYLDPIRLKTAKGYWTGLYSRKIKPEEGAVMILVEQRLGEDDLTAFVKEECRRNNFPLNHICLPIENVSYEVVPASLNEFYGKEGEKKGLMNTTVFGKSWEAVEGLAPITRDSQYGQSPSMGKGGEIDTNWIRLIPLSKWKEKCLASGMGAHQMVSHALIDCSLLNKQESDPNGLGSVMYAPFGVGFMDYETVRMGTVELRKHLFDSFLPRQRFYFEEASTIEIEPKANGVALVSEIRNKDFKEEYGLRDDLAVGHWNNYIIGRIPSRDGGTKKLYFYTSSKRTRIGQYLQRLEQGAVYFVYRDEDGPNVRWIVDMLKELRAFPKKGVNDEAVDLLSYALAVWTSGSYKELKSADRFKGDEIMGEDEFFTGNYEIDVNLESIRKNRDAAKVLLDYIDENGVVWLPSNASQYLRNLARRYRIMNGG